MSGGTGIKVDLRAYRRYVVALGVEGGLVASLRLWTAHDSWFVIRLVVAAAVLSYMFFERHCRITPLPEGQKRSWADNRGMKRAPKPSAFAGFRFPAEVITLAVRWYLRYNLSYRDLEELLLERGIEVDHATLQRWVFRFTPLLIEAARRHRFAASDQWHVDETYVKVNGKWQYLYRAIDAQGQVVDVMLSQSRNLVWTKTFFLKAKITHHNTVMNVIVTDKAPVYIKAVRDKCPGARHVTDRWANNIVEGDHGRLKARLRPMRGLKREKTTRVVVAGHAFVQNIRRGHYRFRCYQPDPRRRVKYAFDQVALTV